MSSSSRLLEVMDALASSMDEPSSLADTRRRIVDTAVDAVPGVDFASITVLHTDTGQVETTAETETFAHELDNMQYELQEGPCFDGVTEEELVVATDLAADPRWPQYAGKAAAAGVRSQIAIRLRNGRQVSGLNLYSRRVGGFEEPLHEARLVARHARVVLGYARQLESLNEALESRTEIGRAIGILMERYTLDSDRAFQFLVRVSKDSNTKIRDLASQIVAGESPGPD